MAFKTGDRVRRITYNASYCGVLIGEVYTVARHSGGTLYLEDIPNYSFDPQYFELVKQSDPSYGFMVHRVGGLPLRVIHKTVELAQAEAERLSKQYPGTSFKVLELTPVSDVQTVMTMTYETKVTPL